MQKYFRRRKGGALCKSMKLKVETTKSIDFFLGTCILRSHLEQITPISQRDFLCGLLVLKILFSFICGLKSSNYQCFSSVLCVNHQNVNPKSRWRWAVKVKLM